MTNEIKNVPELRFPGFKDEWKENFISEVVDFYSGLTYSPDDITNEKGTFVIRSSNIKNNRLINADNVYVNLKNLKVEKVDKGDIIVVVRNGSRKLIGKHALVSTYLNNTVIGAFMTGIRSDYNLFINALLDTENFKRNIHMNLGATINQITTGMFKKMKFYFPKNQEQQIIGDFFSKLDRQIELEEQKLAKLEEQKKGYMQKIFSQQLRFKDEHSYDYPDWKRTKLINIVTPLKGQDNNITNLPVLTISASRGWLNQKERFSQVIAGNSLKNYTQVKKNDLSYNKGNSKVAKYGIVFRLKNEALVPNVYKSFRPNENIDSIFIEKYFHNKTLDKQLRTRITSTARTDGLLNISDQDFYDLKLYIPILQEQTKIADFLSELDKLIKKQSDKVELLKDRKKGFLQKMFV